MTLQPGKRFGAYEVLDFIGAGGMGEVYRARDPRLARDVAIKVLPLDRLADPDRRRRFVQEAQAASALNHPHIITIYDIETTDDHECIVMEYVRGKSLDAVIPRQGMRLGEALRIAIGVADALAAAHARGVIHRDLKPANVMVGVDGAVKVVDFGLAKLQGDEDASDPDLTVATQATALTTPGTIVGTVAYMSPEQATGGPIDPRSDVFSFGAMLYEMATGVRAFGSASAAESLSAVLRDQPKAPGAIVHDLPGDLEKVILRCLRKDPQRRFQHMDDVKVALQDIKEESESGVGVSTPVARTRRRERLAILGAAVILVAAASAWVLRSHRPAEGPPPRVVPLTTLRGMEWHPTFSPDGEQVAFEWDVAQESWDIYVMLMGSSNVRRLTNDPAKDRKPEWSPDGRQIAFLRDRAEGSTIQVVSPLGGEDRKLSDFVGADSISWSPDARWLVTARPSAEGAPGQPRGIFLISLDTGEARPLILSSPEAPDFNPAFSPDGRRLVYASCSRNGASVGRCDVYLVELDAAYKPSTPGRRLTKQGSSFIDALSWTRDGSAVVYAAATPDWGLWRVDVDGSSAPQRIELAGNNAHTPAVAPHDGLAFARVSTDYDLYRFEVAAGRSVQLAFGTSAMDVEARLSPDGRRLVFGSERPGEVEQIWVAEADGSHPQRLTRGPARSEGSPYWSPDGRRIVYDSFGDDLHYHLWMIDADGGSPHRLETKAGDEHTPTWSRDGRWIYFTSAQGGAARDVWRVSADGGTSERLIQGGSGPFALESNDGQHLLYQTKDNHSPLMLMPLAGGEARQLVACVQNSAFATGPEGVYYVACDPNSNAPLHVIDPETGRDRLLGMLEGLTWRPLGLTVSPDGKTIVYPRNVRTDADLMLIENFR